MDDVLWRTLLLESEGTRLDFKLKQYRFVNASDEEKSELLKDLLAFANSWRTEAAYILVGVGAGPAGERELLGLHSNDHFDDAAIQQFANSKLNRELTFSYHPFSSNGQSFGIIEIPVQERPFFTERDYGRVRRHVVYFRRGSSTAEASPAQIAQMGRDDAAARRAGQPLLIVSFADIDKRLRIGQESVIHSRMHSKNSPTSLPDLVDRQHKSTLGLPVFGLHRARRDFWRELAEHIRDRRRFAEVGLMIRNESTVPAENVRIVLDTDHPALEVREHSEMPAYPKSHYDLLNHTINIPGRFPLDRHSTLPRVSRQAGRWEIVIELGTIRPSETVWIPKPVFVSVNKPGTVTFRSTVYAANLAEPADASLRLVVEVELMQALGIDELKDIQHQGSLEIDRQGDLADDDNTAEVEDG